MEDSFKVYDLRQKVKSLRDKASPLGGIAISEYIEDVEALLAEIDDFENKFDELETECDRKVDAAHSEGWDDGWSEGHTEGIDEGRAEIIKEMEIKIEDSRDELLDFLKDIAS